MQRSLAFHTIECVGSIKCEVQSAGSETAVHAMKDMFDKDICEAALLVDFVMDQQLASAISSLIT